MPFTIFSSRPAGLGPHSKELVRTEVVNEEEMRQQSTVLRERGHEINGVLPYSNDSQGRGRRRKGEQA